MFICWAGGATAEEHASVPDSGPPGSRAAVDLGCCAGLVGAFYLQQPAEIESRNQDRLDALIDELPFPLRNIARPRLKKAVKTFAQIEITTEAKRLGIRTDGFKSFVWTALDGRFHDFKNTPKGDFKLRRWVEKGILHTEAKKNGPLKRNRYFLSADGKTLRLEVTVTSKFLPQPLRLTYIYKKKP